MRILKLTDAVATKFLARRRSHDAAAEKVAASILADVRKNGDAALFRWALRLDGLRLTRKSLWIARTEIRAARRNVPGDLLIAIEHAVHNIRRVAEEQRLRPWTITVEPGVRVGQRVTPLETIGCYIPGGRFSLFSTLLMTALPAQVAGVKRIVVACPKPSPALLAAAEILGVTEIARMGGAQAIGAFAYGTPSIPRVDKICGPGNRYVTAAKRIVSNDCAIDMPAGPTEVLILATGGSPRYIAADVLAQAEHDPDAVALLVTPSRSLAKAVSEEVEKQLHNLPKTNPAWRSLRLAGAILVASSLDAAIRFANRVAPEHLSIPDSSKKLVEGLCDAGSVFLGPWSAQPIGDYASGTNHVLPTSGWARARGGLSVMDFVKCSSTQQISRAGLKRLAPIATAMARAEGLEAHARAVEVRQ
ncbi:MAG TPA: histidinol dehydrogenase [Candidatus Acidoferrales bacterium]|jgi:histidinol dehydrogenase|nr:histidinol dehydrogenase [Candidatus Acidoferrales bacterium]